MRNCRKEETNGARVERGCACVKSARALRGSVKEKVTGASSLGVTGADLARNAALLLRGSVNLMETGASSLEDESFLRDVCPRLRQHRRCHNEPDSIQLFCTKMLK
mmetsp:Transcript_9537/g.15586  ORF Transcript_9537/g.15586 Transcript_9537/m.15586 type:complete len:106 (+) Transcript_9537:401-718(+)